MDVATEKMLKILMHNTKTKWTSGYEDNHNGVIDLQSEGAVKEKVVRKVIDKVMTRYGNDEEYEVNCQKSDDGLTVYVDVRGWAV